MPRVTLEELKRLAARALERAGAGPAMAEATVKALVTADAQGLASHGVSRVPQYAAHLRLGRADGAAAARVVATKGGAVLVDAADGLAFPACALAVAEAVTRARAHGVAFAGVANSHHFGVASVHLEPVAAAMMVGIAFGNSPSAMPAWGGKRALFGTNPIAAVFPRRERPPIVVDLSLSEVARGKLMVAARDGKPIPLGWALDQAGNPTTDPRAGLDGMMLPAGGVKGAMLALVVELLCCALTGAHFGFEADSFFTDAGNRPRIGQAFLVVDPGALAGSDVYAARVEALHEPREFDVELLGHSSRAAETAERIGVAPADEDRPLRGSREELGHSGLAHERRVRRDLARDEEPAEQRSEPAVAEVLQHRALSVPLDERDVGSEAAVLREPPDDALAERVERQRRDGARRERGRALRDARAHELPIQARFATSAAAPIAIAMTVKCSLFAVTRPAENVRVDGVAVAPSDGPSRAGVSRGHRAGTAATYATAAAPNRRTSRSSSIRRFRGTYAAKKATSDSGRSPNATSAPGSSSEDPATPNPRRTRSVPK